MAAAEIARAGVPVIVDPEQDLPSSFDSLGSRLDNAARLQAAGVQVAILGSFDFNNLRQARFNAGTAVANGLPYEAAIASITSVPAKIWGFGDKAGSLAPGRDADVVVWSGDPLETSTWPEAVFVAGREQRRGADFPPLIPRKRGPRLTAGARPTSRRRQTLGPRLRGDERVGDAQRTRGHAPTERTPAPARRASQALR